MANEALGSTISSIPAEFVAIMQTWVDRLVNNAIATASKNGHLPKITVTNADILYLMQIPQGTKPH
jgi:hypothetical protein